MGAKYQTLEFGRQKVNASILADSSLTKKPSTFKGFIDRKYAVRL